MSREPPPQGVESVSSTSRRTILRLVRRLVVAVLGQARLRFCRRQAVAGIRRCWPVHERVVALEPPTLTRLDRPRDLISGNIGDLQTGHHTSAVAYRTTDGHRILKIHRAPSVPT